MAQRSFNVEFRGRTLVVTVEYAMEDPAYWEHVSALQDGEDILAAIEDDSEAFPPFDRECAYAMNEWQNTQEGPDPMDAVHAAIEDEMVRRVAGR